MSSQETMMKKIKRLWNYSIQNKEVGHIGLTNILVQDKVLRDLVTLRIPGIKKLK